MMCQANHPSDGRFGDGPIYRSDRDEHEHIGRRAGRYVDRVVSDAEAPDGQ